MTQKLWRYHGGIVLPDHKSESTGRPIAVMPVPRHIVLPLHQHIGAPAKPVVEVGDRVLKGQVVATAEGYVSAPVHASTSGTVTAIEERPVPHPSGLSDPCIVIEADGKDEALGDHPAEHDYTAMNTSALRNLVRDAGIVGLGGAGFPSFIKLNPGPRMAIDVLILNGAECEPYITCDDMLMRERAEEVVAGARIMRHALQARRAVVAIEDNKPEAIEAIRKAIAAVPECILELIVVPARYPTGGEKQLIKVITGKEVPSQGLPLDIGIVCHNVTTAAAVHRAVEHSEPLVSRIVTVSGAGVAEPQNVEVRIGAPIEEVLAFCGGLREESDRLVMGGPMMGFELTDRSVPVVKTTNCLLAMMPEETGEYRRGPVLPCIRCGACTDVCPANLLPQQLYWYARSKDFDKAQDYKLFDCIECGCCAYVCPSNLPLVQYFRFAKTEIWSQEREKKKSDLARQRHEFRQQRIEREKAERAARMKKKKEAVKGGGKDDAKKKEAIQAAMERAKAKREQSDVAPRNVDNLTAEQRRKIEEADARRAARKAQRREAVTETEDDKNDQ